MADINQTITLGIGTPAGVPEFLTFGLQIGVVVAVTTPASRIHTPGAESRIYTPGAESRIYTVPAESRIYTVS